MLSCALELGDVVVDRVEADVLTVDPERHEHHLHVDQLPVLPYATSDPVGTTSLERLVGDVPAFSAEVLVEDEVVDQTPDRLLRRVAKELRRRRVPARHTLVGVHDDDGDRADLDERLEVLLLAADLGVALPRLLDSAHAGKGGADMLSDEGEQFLVLLGVRELLRVGLDDERAHRPPPRGHERNAEPVLAHLAPELELALRNQLLLPLPREAIAVRPFGARTRWSPSPPGCRTRPTCWRPASRRPPRRSSRAS